MFLLCVVLCVFVWAGPVYGAGFSLYQQGTAAMAQGGAFVADASDPSAIFYNPAGISQLKRPEFYSATIFNYPDREFHGPGGDFSQTNHRLYRTPGFYMAGPLNNRVSIGLGFFIPWGLGSAWPPEWQGRYITTFSSLRTYNLNPVISVKPFENLSVAAGFNAMWSVVRLKRAVPVIIGPFQLPDGQSNLGGEGEGVGYNLGALWEPISGIKLGVSFRSEVKVTHTGNLDVTLPSQLPAPFHPQRNIGGWADLTYPPILAMGIAYSRFKPFTFEFDAVWTGWSTYDVLRVDIQSPIRVNGLKTWSVVQPKNWRDSWAFRFGANYEVKPGMKLRVGYVYDLTPVPDESFEPQLPDANRHIFAVGSDLKFWRFTLGIAYNFILLEDRTKVSAIGFNGVPLPTPFQANGRYETHIHSLGLSFGFQF